MMVEDQLTHDQRLRLEALGQATAMYAVGVKPAASAVVNRAKAYEDYVRGVPEAPLNPRGAEDVARCFHQTYEELAPEFEYQTREASAVPWDEVPLKNRRLMVAVVARLIEDKVISA